MGLRASIGDERAQALASQADEQCRQRPVFGRALGEPADRPREPADVALMGNELHGPARFLRLSWQTARVLRQNIALALALSAPTPNPSRGRTTWTLTLAAPAHVRAVVVDALGRTVGIAFDGLAAGPAVVSSGAACLTPGVFVLRVNALERSGVAWSHFTIVR